jgi:hypothetical protein
MKVTRVLTITGSEMELKKSRTTWSMLFVVPNWRGFGGIVESEELFVVGIRLREAPFRSTTRG